MMMTEVRTWEGEAYVLCPTFVIQFMKLEVGKNFSFPLHFELNSSFYLSIYLFCLFVCLFVLSFDERISLTLKSNLRTLSDVKDCFVFC